MHIEWPVVLVSPGGEGMFFPFFGPLVVSLRIGYLKAVYFILFIC